MGNKDELKKNSCGCGENCTCGDNCNCNDHHRCSDDCTCNSECHCNDHCTCGDECNCTANDKCSEDCTCGSHCDCGAGCDCNSYCVEDECTCHSKELEYLELAQRIKAEFDNYKRRNADIASQSFNNGVASTVTKLLPVIDSFKQAKANIKDEDTLKGLDLLEGLIIKAFNELKVEKIDCIGKDFDPNYHNAVLTGEDNTKPDGMILEEYQQGFKLGDRVIRYSVVKINKLS